MSDTVTVPDGMRITVWHSLTESTSMPVRPVLDVPTAITGSYDGSAPGWAPETPPRRLIRFSFGFSAHLAGYGWAELNEIAAVIASHLAAMDEGWPGSEAHVRLYPVVEFRMMWEVTPDRQPEAPAPPNDLTLSLLSQIAPGLTGKIPASVSP